METGFYASPGRYFESFYRDLGFGSWSRYTYALVDDADHEDGTPTMNNEDMQCLVRDRIMALVEP